MVLLFEVNSSIAAGILFFFLHEITALWDVNYGIEKSGPIEQHVHSFCDTAARINSGNCQTLVSFIRYSDWVKVLLILVISKNLPTWYLLSVIAVATKSFYYIEELIRGMKAKKKFTGKNDAVFR